MSITAVDFHVLMGLRREGVLPERPSVLELGEAELHVQPPGDALSECIDAVVAQPDERVRWRAEREAIERSDSPDKHYNRAKLFYRLLLDYSSIKAIDLGGGTGALKLDLNKPVDLRERFDVLINDGTAEHVFNVYQFYKTCHELTKPGGLMIHTAPFRGWVDHGFYNFNPTFFWDLADANRYVPVMMVYTELDPVRLVQLPDRQKITEMAREKQLGESANLVAVLRKHAVETPFSVPFQGIYSAASTEELAKTWHDVTVAKGS